MWRDVEGYEGRYQVSDSGQIRSLAREVEGMRGRTLFVKERLLKHCFHYKGYPIVWLYRGEGKKKFFVHRLVAKAYVANGDGKPIVNHKNLDKGDCRAENLEWATESENTQHYYDNQEPF